MCLISILFNMLNDLPETFQSSLALFADDLCFWEIRDDVEELNKMAQNFVNKIDVWFYENEITISNTKFTAILFMKKQKNKEITLTINNLSIDTSKQIKHFGVIF